MLRAMERVPLRPVPRRPEGPVDPEAALRHVTERLPTLDPLAATALALVEIGGRTRSEAAAAAAVSGDELGEALANARRELRRSLRPLRGSGWCERAERSLSDRLDGELEPPHAQRLDVHLRNCPRCVEHERWLAQATDSLLREFLERHAAQRPRPEGEAGAALAAPELSVVREAPAEAEPAAAAGPSRQRLATLGWYALFTLAVLLIVAAVVMALVGLL
jgi:hypothetical protein